MAWKNGVTQQNAKKSWEVWVVLSGFVFLTFGNMKFWNWRVENSEPRYNYIFQDCNSKKKNKFLLSMVENTIGRLADFEGS